MAFVEQLKAQPGGDIHLAGGAQLARTLIRLGVVDRYHLYVYPLVSAGASWFDEIERAARARAAERHRLLERRGRPVLRAAG